MKYSLFLAIVFANISVPQCMGLKLKSNGIKVIELKKQFHDLGRGFVIGCCLMTSPLSFPHNACASDEVLNLQIRSSAVLSTEESSMKSAVFDEIWKIVNDNYVDDTFNGQDWEEIKRINDEKLEDGADEKALVKKVLGSLGDKYTRFMDKSSYEALWKYDAIGIGSLFQSDTGEPLKVAGPPISGSTSEKAGLKKDDVIVSINGKLTDGMTAMNVLEMMSNDESDVVELEYARLDLIDGEKVTFENAKKVSKKVSLKRTKDKATNPISYSFQILPNGKKIGYIKFSDFNAQAVPNLRNAVVSLNKEDVDDILLDIRGNTGGGFQFALNIGGMFMDNKPMVTAEGHNGEKSEFRSSFPEGVLYKKNIVLLTDGLSASASEVLAAGLRDNCRAVTTGSKTFGKGKIQAVFGLKNGEGLVMTVAQYITPKGQIIQSRGIAPDLAGGPATNAYLNMIIGSTVDTKPDLANIDWDKSHELLDACIPVK